MTQISNQPPPPSADARSTPAEGSAFYIRARSVMGWPVWVIYVDETKYPNNDEFGDSPTVRCGNREKHATRYTLFEAERLLELVRTAYPSAEIVTASIIGRVSGDRIVTNR